MIRIVPRSGMVVVDPSTRRPLPIDGVEVVELDSYWIRRRNDGDVTTTDPFEEAVAQAQIHRG